MTWTRSRIAKRCISCLHEIAPGDPIRLVTIADRPWCAACARVHLDEAPPEDLPDLVVPPVIDVQHRPGTSLPFEPLASIRRRVTLPFDAKRRASGEEDS